MENIRNGLYALAIAVVASTIILSVSLGSAAGTISEGLAQVKVGVPVAVGGSGTGAQPTVGVQQQPTAEPTTVQQAPRGKLDLSNAASEGSKDAKIVLVEYSDFQCPFCGRFYTGAEVEIKKNYIDTGKVRLVYKNFPLDSIHPNARPAAIAFECARQDDEAKAWLFRNKMFENQGSLSDASYAQWIKDVGLDSAKFSTCYTTKASEPVVNAQFQEGANNGIQGTPGFLITDASGNIVLPEISGAQPYAVFQAALEQALNA